MHCPVLVTVTNVTVYLSLSFMESLKVNMVMIKVAVSALHSDLDMWPCFKVNTLQYFSAFYVAASCAVNDPIGNMSCLPVFM